MGRTAVTVAGAVMGHCDLLPAFDSVKAPCRECGITITNQKNVGEERHLWPGPRTDYLCMSCHLKKMDRLVERTRRELGFQEAPKDQKP